MRLLLIFTSFLFTSATFCQQFGNEWIDYSLPYYKFPVVESGVYRIDYEDLMEAGIPLSSIDPQSIFIVAAGNEIPLYIKNEGNPQLEPNDYIEFYADANTAFLDTILYKGKNNQPNPYYSLINDTLFYFLSYDPLSTHKRFKIENNTDFSSYFSANYLLKKVSLSFSSNYYDGEILSTQNTDVEYVATEGYMDRVVTAGNTRSHNITTPNFYISGPSVEYEFKISGQSNYGGINNGDHHLQIDFLGQSMDTIFEGFKLLHFKGLSSPSNLKNSNQFKISSINDLGVASDRTALAFVDIVYPHKLTLDNSSYFEFMLNDNPSQNAYTVNFANFNSSVEPILYDITNSKRIKVSQNLNGYRAIILNGNGRKKCVLLSDTSVKQIAYLKTVSSTAYFTDYSKLAVDSAYLIIGHPTLMQSAKNYSTYRNNTSYHPIIIDIEELYHQFAYGIEKHPLSIRNFANFCLNTWPSPPQYLLLLGKSISAKSHRKNATSYSENLVPSIGNPAADNLFTSGLLNTFYETAIPTGRIAANTNSQVEDYLSKVVEYENAPRSMWMKRALHFAGGSNSSQVNHFSNYLNYYESIYEDSVQAGKVLTFKKTQNVPIQTSLSDSIRELVKEGVSLMCFFGHASSTGGFDISIDDADKFQNKGKYPVILANSCFSGDIHQAGAQSTSEDFVLQPNKGTIAFIASVNLSQASFLNLYSSAFYENAFKKEYGKSLAYNMMKTVQQVQSSSTNPALKSVCLEMSLHGDPALSFYAFDYPDYSIEQSSVSFNPNDISTELDSFEISIQIENLGRGNLPSSSNPEFTDSLLVEIVRKFPDNSFSDSSYFLMTPKVLYSSTVKLKLAVDILKGVGLNKFIVKVDPIDQIRELSELNNSVEVDLQIKAGSIVPVYPYQYALVGHQVVDLIASTADAFEENRRYVFELDTNDSFSSAFKKRHTVNSSGGVVRWQADILKNMEDSAVYFWRVSRDASIDEDYLWKESSFQYIPGNMGWSQDHFSQFLDNNYLFLHADKHMHQLEFIDNVKELYVYAKGSPSISELNNIRYQVDTDTRERSGCTTIPAFFVAVLDSLSLDSWETPYFGQNQDHQFGQANYDNYCGSNRMRPEKYFVFRSNSSSQLTAMQNLLENEVPRGNYLLIYNWFNIDFSNIKSQHPGLMQAIVDLGADSMQYIQDNHPFIVLAKKGYPLSSINIIGDSVSSEVELRTTLSSSSSFGNMRSIAIGPSTNWKEVKWDYSSLELNSADSVSLDILGIDKNGEEVVLKSLNSSQKNYSIQNQISEEDYPYLKLQFNTSDLQHQSPAQLLRWQVSHTPLPELALNPNKHFSINNDSLQQGEVLKLSIAIENIGKIDADSLLVAYTVIDKTHNFHSINYPRQAALLADSSFISTIEIPSHAFVGKNTLMIDVNPNGDQAEQFHFNNVAQFDFFVESDQQNPLLDVTFDGKHILNREIVSAKPEIVIQLTDDNKYLALDDTSSISVYLTAPGKNERKLSFYNSLDQNFKFYPAKLPENKARIIYRPEYLEDGIYKLRIQAKDRSGNESGKFDYAIEFEVVTKSSITHMVNYPNPFTTSTRFVFTLTGSKIPDDIQIQIMTITGKVVKEIFMEELGPIRIGNNITEYAWDGTDEFGDRLANGIYLYRIRTKMNGHSMEHRESASDKFFKQGFGKMYLMR